MSTNPLCLLCASPANTRRVARFLVCNDLSLGRSVGRFIAARGDDFIHQSHADALTMWLTLPAICSNKVTKINVLKILHSQSFKLIEFMVRLCTRSAPFQPRNVCLSPTREKKSYTSQMATTTLLEHLHAGPIPDAVTDCPTVTASLRRTALHCAAGSTRRSSFAELSIRHTWHWPRYRDVSLQDDTVCCTT